MDMHTDALILYSDALVERAEVAAAHVIARQGASGSKVCSNVTRWCSDMSSRMSCPGSGLRPTLAA